MQAHITTETKNNSVRGKSQNIYTSQGILAIIFL